MTSVDNDGVEKGPDIELINVVSKICKIPLIVSGGISNLVDLEKINKINNIDAICLSSALHYNNLKISDIKKLSNI